MKYNFKNRYKYDVKQKCIDAGFKLSKSFLEADNEDIVNNWNGIGASGRWYNKFIPKTIWLVNVELPSCPHDWQYKVGVNLYEKQRADKSYLYNIIVWVKPVSTWFMFKLRRIRAYTMYYSFVSHFGYKFFFKGKIKINNVT